MRPPVSYEIPLSKRAVLTPALMKEGEPVYLSEKEFKALGVDWKAFLDAGAGKCDGGIEEADAGLHPRQKEGDHFATLTSESELTASTVLSPDFLKMFKDTLGDKVIVVIPNRYTVYVFPVLASHYKEYTPDGGAGLPFLDLPGEHGGI